MTDTLARTLWGEARGEGEKGMMAVACVILNRAKKPCWWGKDIESVCRKKWQFSCWNENDPNYQKLLRVTDKDPSFADALAIAKEAVSGMEDITNGATHYFVTKMKNPPKWASGKIPCAVIGSHSFYKDV
jgi:N-acetylmuramoyl-L-alanine amidase